MTTPRAIAARVAALLAALALAGLPVDASAQEPTTVVYVVRHAEKVADGGEDPPLSAEGERRVDALVRMFADAGLSAVYTSPYRRTRDTARPIAEALGLTPREYDPRALDAFARRLAGAGGRHLVIGHSNTNPDLVRALGGSAEPMAEDVYGRIYEVTVGPHGVHTVIVGYAE